MNASRVLLLTFLAAGCAAAPVAGTVPGPVEPSSPEPVAAPAVDPEPEASPDTIRNLAYSIPRSMLGAALVPTSYPGATPPIASQDPAAAPTTPESRHRLSGGVGIRFRDGESALDLLVQYQYFVNRKLDIGGIGDWAMSPINSVLIAPAAWWHPTERLTLFGAPGVEFTSGDGQGGTAALRLGGSWALVLGKLVIRPFGWYDFVDGRDGSFTLGLAFGI